MKIFVVMCAALMFSTMSFAQYQIKDGMNKAKNQSDTRRGSGRTINTISFGVNPMSCTFKVSGEGASISDSDSFLGFSLMWNGAASISGSQLYFGYGAGLQYSYSSKPERWGLDKVRFFAAKIPLELQYRFDFQGSNVSLVPYAGLDAIVNFSGIGILDEVGGHSLYGDGSELNRFNMNWHAGAKLFIDRFFLGAAYEGPIVKLYSETANSITSSTGMSQADIFIGFVF